MRHPITGANGYRGEQIDIRRVLDDIQRVALETLWRRDTLELRSESRNRRAELIAFHRPSPVSRHRVYLSTGIHGDEPAGPLAVLDLLQENLWPEGIDFWLCPCLNLTGFPLNRRENAEGMDLNRDYRHLRTKEVRAHVEWLHQKPRFDVTICLHEDWEADGFYLYELNPEGRPSLAGEVIEAVAPVCPIDRNGRIDGWAAEAGVIRPGADPLDRPQWPEALFLIKNKTRLSYTLETPSAFPLETRVAAHVGAVRAILRQIIRS
jgi:murein peptide amidase A